MNSEPKRLTQAEKLRTEATNFKKKVRNIVLMTLIYGYVHCCLRLTTMECSKTYRDLTYRFVPRRRLSNAK